MDVGFICITFTPFNSQCIVKDIDFVYMQVTL